MSRTVRRKKVTHIPYNIDRLYLKSRGLWDADEGHPIFTSTQYKKYVNAKFHGDTRSGHGWLGAAPSDFRRCLNRIRRSKSNHETRRILKQGDYESYQFDKWVKDAGLIFW